jgi:hypothetical protein
MQVGPDIREPAAPASDYRGRAFLYVLVAAGAEDLLKVGLANDPLARWSAFHPRWFEAFDLDHSLLVETETRGDAQALETALHRALSLHACPVPLTMREAAGGGTEWFRGAYSPARRFVAGCAAEGHVVHLGARPWLQAAMRLQRDRLDGLVTQAHAAWCARSLSSAQLATLRDLVDAHRAFDLDAVSQLPAVAVDELGLQR